MELIEAERPLIPNLITARIPEILKPYLSDLTLLERRKLATVIVMLLNEGVAVKKKVHEHKHTLLDIQTEDGSSFTFNRVPFKDGLAYKDNPGLLVTLNTSPNLISESIKLSKEMALTMAANLSIFLNEVNL